MIVVVHDAIDESVPDIIACTPPDTFRMPFVVEWLRNNQPVDDETTLSLDQTRLCARKALPGRYSVVIRDAMDNQVVAQTDVHQVRLPRVVSYVGTPVTSSMSRNGRVEAIVEDMPRGCQFLWTHGATTSEPILRHAPMGIYTVAPVAQDGTPIAFVHVPAPFHVKCNPDLLS